MSIEVLIDLTGADLELSSEDFETYCFQMVEEMKDGLVENAYLLRQPLSSEGAMAGEASFITGILQAEVNFKNIQIFLNWLGERFYGKTKRIVYKDAGGNELTFEYQTSKDLEQQQKALEVITSLITVRVIALKE